AWRSCAEPGALNLADRAELGLSPGAADHSMTSRNKTNRLADLLPRRDLELAEVRPPRPQSAEDTSHFQAGPQLVIALERIIETDDIERQRPLLDPRPIFDDQRTCPGR